LVRFPFGEAHAVIAPYAEKLSFQLGVSIRFEHFELTFTKKRHEVVEMYQFMLQFSDFEFVHSAGAFIVTWSPGTGDISPTVFRIAGDTFILELGLSGLLGQLQDDQLVIVRIPHSTSSVQS